MLSNQWFYHSLTRKYIVLFGNIFNNLMIKRLVNGVEIERIKVPLVYANKEKFVTRLDSDPELTKEVAMTLPRISYEMVGITYDAPRKQTSLLRVAQGNTSTGVTAQYMSVPYDLAFELTIYARNVDDGTHIVEQILPYFNPTLTMTMTEVPAIGKKKDIPIILESVTPSMSYEGDSDSVRYVYWTLSFKMKADYWGPVSEPKIIRKVITNFINDPALQTGSIIRINTVSGNGDFKIGDTMYQGNTYSYATAYGTVISWSNTTDKLVIAGAQGQFLMNTTIKGYSTNASYQIHSFDATPVTLATITIEPDPLNALPNSDYGYTTTIEEFPDTLT